MCTHVYAHWLIRSIVLFFFCHLVRVMLFPVVFFFVGHFSLSPLSSPMTILPFSFLVLVFFTMRTAQVHSKPLLVLVKLFYCSMIRLVFNMKISFLYCILEVCWIFELSLCWNVPWIDFKLSDRFTVSCQNYGKIFNEPISTNGIIFDIL